MRFIKFSLYYLSVAAVLGLSGCMSTGLDTNTSELKKLGQDILADAPSSISTTEQANGADVNLAANTNSNDYLAKQQALMATVPTELKAQYQQAVAAIKQQNWAMAKQLFTELTKAQPELTGSYLNLAIIAEQQQDDDLAKQLISQALKLNPDNPYAHHQYALLARKRGDFEQAEQSYLKALAIWPDYPQAHLNLAILAELYRGKWQLAQQHYQAYLAMRPEDQQVQHWLASLNLKLGNSVSKAVSNGIATNETQQAGQ